MNVIEKLDLTQHEIHKAIKASLPATLSGSQNILAIQDEFLFVYNQEDRQVFCLNLRSFINKDSKNVGYQVLIPSQPIAFDVTLIRINTVLSYVALAGPRGISVLELPRRSGDGFGNGRDILCKNHLLDERFFTCSSFVECKQVKWHPGSPNDNHLLALVSNNSFRLYKIGGTSKLERIWSIGENPTGKMGSSKTPILVALGETGVDFDFAPAQTVRSRRKIEKKTWESLVYPIYILKGNGDTYMYIAELYGNEFENGELCGPLHVLPAADDNYGSDACAIICLDSSPPIIAISTCSGTLYHCVALPCDEEDSLTSQTSVNTRLHSFARTLYVYERTELEFGLSIFANDVAYSTPIFFHKDVGCRSRYFCSHDFGVCSVTLPMVKQLDEYFNASEDFADDLSLSPTENSTVEYLICTQATPTSTKPNPVYGVGLSYNPHYLVTLLSNGEMVTIPLISVILPMPRAENEDDVDGSLMEIAPARKVLSTPFTEQVKALLGPKTRPPLLKLSVSAEEETGNVEVDLNRAKEFYKIFQRGKQIFEDDYFVPHDKFMDAIEKRVKALTILKNHQIAQLKRLDEEKERAQQKAEDLAEKYEECNDKSMALIKRLNNVIRLIYEKQPVQSQAEEKFSAYLLDVKEKLEQYKKMVKDVKIKLKYQEIQIEQWKQQETKRKVHLNSNQEMAISKMLSQLNTETFTLKKDVILLSEDIGLNTTEPTG